MWQNNGQVYESITEEFVQNTALEYLKRHYSSNPLLPIPFRKVTTFLEARTKEGNYADGLVIYKDGKKYFTASLEAKSRNTINVIRPYFNDNHFNYRQQIFVAIMSIFLIALLSYLKISVYHALLFGVMTFGLGNILLFRRTPKNEKIYSTVDVFRQMKQYPANEKWLAVPEDCFDEKITKESLKNVCKREEVGLLIVSGKGRVEVVVEPVRKFGNYLSNYSGDNRIASLLPSGN